MHIFKITRRVIYADTDKMGIVYHSNYLRWFEMGRTEMLRELGHPYTEIEAAGYNESFAQLPFFRDAASGFKF